MIEELADLADYIASFIQHKEQERVKRRGLTEQDKELIERGFKRYREMLTTFDEVSRHNREHPYSDPRCSKGYKPGTRYVPPKARREEKTSKGGDYSVKTEQGKELASELWEKLL